ncbi:hypothetical protein [Paracoccus sp. ME4]|uniref:hypothetical protein n=1 Tax=Paracoccus sp. ME4 TaxID=3138066 RepID=UPI00398A7159
MQLGQDLIADEFTLDFLGHGGQFIEQLFEGQLRIAGNRLHLCKVLKGSVEVDGIEDTEDLFADIIAAAGGPA